MTGEFTQGADLEQRGWKGGEAFMKVGGLS